MNRRKFLQQLSTVPIAVRAVFGKCDYCKRYSPLGACEGCGEPNTPVPTEVAALPQAGWICSGWVDPNGWRAIDYGTE